jgi:hypothetical protein
MIRVILLACAIVVTAMAAWGQTVSGPMIIAPATVGTGSAQVSGSHLRTYLGLFNQHATATIYCTLDGTAAVAAATAGQITLGPLGNITWAGSKVPSNAINCIASGASTPLTIME